MLNFLSTSTAAKDDGKDKKAQDAKIPLPVPMRHTLLHNRAILSGAKGGAKGGSRKLETIRTRLVATGNVSAAANTAVTAVVNVDPTASSEFTSFAALFDEVKVHGGSFHFRVASAGGSPSYTDLAVAYDPMDSTVYGSVSGILVADQHIGPLIALASTGVTASIFDPEPVNKTGFWTLKFRCPEQGQKVASATAADQEITTGLWSSTNLSLTPKYGFIKPYVPAAGASVVIAIYYYLVMDVSFRSRT
jgi:hypothetical protein